MNRVVVTGMGAITPVGADVATTFAALLAGESAIRPLDAPWAAAGSTLLWAPVTVDVESHFPKLRRMTLDRVSQLALLAVQQAVAQSAIAWDAAASERCGIFWGTGMGGATSLEAAYNDLLVAHAARLRPSTIVMVMNNAAAGQIGIEYGIHGPSFTYSSACSSSLVALGEAFRAVRSGYVESAIVGGAEALLTEGVIKAWSSLQTLARPDPAQPSTSCRPFAADRTGFVLGEGAAALILESEASARARGATILAAITGYGNTTDASHITQPDAAGQARAMKLALADAGLDPGEIGYLNAHGTGTKVGDLSETHAIKAIFGSHARALPVSATKALHGHLMGATGAVEMVVALAALRSGTLPPTAHLRSPDPECDLDYIAEGARQAPGIAHVMSNSFGFGGSNAVVVASSAA